MRYIITENRMENIIKYYLLDNYDLYKVDFSEKKVQLGSGAVDGETIINVKVVNIYVDNIDGKTTSQEMYTISGKIWDDLNTLFGLELGKYGSKWDLNVYEITKKLIR